MCRLKAGRKLDDSFGNIINEIGIRLPDREVLGGGDNWFSHHGERQLGFSEHVRGVNS
jgi:hypothetical protein